MGGARWAYLCLGLLLVPSGSADWLQWNHDERRSSLSEATGPRHDDVALRLQLPGCCGSTTSGPVVIGKHAYVATNNKTLWQMQDYAPTPGEWEALNKSQSAIWRIDLDTGVVTRLAEAPIASLTMLSDGERLYLSHKEGYTAYDLDGRQLWTWSPYTGLMPYWYQHFFTECRADAIVDDHLYVACIEGGRYIPEEGRQVPDTGFRAVNKPGYSHEGYMTVGVVASLDLSDHSTPRQEWAFTIGGGSLSGKNEPTAPPSARWGARLSAGALGVAVVGNRVISLYHDIASSDAGAIEIGILGASWIPANTRNSSHTWPDSKALWERPAPCRRP